MLKVERPGPGILVVSQRPIGAALRLAIWTGVVVIFYAALIIDLELTESGPADHGLGWQTWMLLLFPIFLSSYLFALLRGLRGVAELLVDAEANTLSARNQPLASFSDVREIQLRSVHGTCEEYRLSAILEDARSIVLLEAEASPATEALAREIAALLEVELTRAA